MIRECRVRLRRGEDGVWGLGRRVPGFVNFEVWGRTLWGCGAILPFYGFIECCKS